MASASSYLSVMNNDKLIKKSQNRDNQNEPVSNEINFTAKRKKDLFVKKKWREMKHSKKAQIQQKEEKRRKFLERRYKKELRKEGIKLSKADSDSENRQKISKIKEAQLEYEARKKEQEEARQIREEKMLKIKEMREKRAARHRKLNQKTRKGQPLMRGKLELLQEKIEKMIAENKL